MPDMMDMSHSSVCPELLNAFRNNLKKFLTEGMHHYLQQSQILYFPENDEENGLFFLKKTHTP